MVLTSAAEGEARPRPDLVHIELLEVDIAQVDVLEETTSGSEQHRHHVDAEFVTGNYFVDLGARPLTGRLLTGDDDRPGAAPVAVLSERFWRARGYLD